MKHLKMLGAAVAAALVLMALLGGGTASATVLCKTETNPCSSVYPGEGTTELKADLVSEQSIFELTDAKNTELSWCSEETITASISNAGGLFSKVVAPVTALEFKCAGFTKVVTAGSLEFQSIVGTINGTVTVSELEITLNVSGADCKWRVTNADLGTLEGGSDPTLKINLVLARNSICYPEFLGRWTATFTFTSPIYVEPS